MNTNESRNNIIDIAKAICITAVVMGHCGLYLHNLRLGFFVNSFKMPFFFMVAGYLFNEKYSENIYGVCAFIWKKIKRLWFPYWFWTSMFIVLNNKFALYGLISMPEVGFMSHGDMLNEILKAIDMNTILVTTAPYWFFKILFLSSILFCVVVFCLNNMLNTKNNNILLAMVSGLFLVLGYHDTSSGYVDARGLVAFSLFYIGFIVKKIENITFICNMPTGIFGIMSVIVLLLWTRFGDIDMRINYIGTIPFFLTGAIAGTFFLLLVSKYIATIKCLKVALCIIGQHSLSILLFHWISFKLVSFVYLLMTNRPVDLLSITPTIPDLAASSLWFIYVIVGISFPLGISVLYNYVLKVFHNFVVLKPVISYSPTTKVFTLNIKNGKH